MVNEEGLDIEDIELETLESEPMPPDGFEEREHRMDYVRSLIGLLDERTQNIVTEFYFGSPVDDKDGVMAKYQRRKQNFRLIHVKFSETVIYN